MKGKLLFMGGMLAIIVTGRSEVATIGLWDFNSRPADSSVATGRATPAIGTGTAALVGGASGSFAAGTAADSGSDNSGWSTAAYPAVGTANKTAGVEFRLSTRGYSNIVLSWEQRATGSASRYSRLQYSINGMDYSDAAVVNLRSNNTYYPQRVSLSGLSGVDNNPNFAFRIVAEFESTATGAGAAAYATPLRASYSSSGTVRFDLLRMEGAPLRPDNTPPTIAPVLPQSTLENQPIVGIPIEMDDDATPAAELALRVTSSNPNLIPDRRVTISGTGYSREMSIDPQPGQSGVAVISLQVSDAENLSSAISFTVTVFPLNSPPMISSIRLQRRVMGEPAPAVPFVVGDLETASRALMVSAHGSNPELIEDTGLLLGGAGVNRTLQFNSIAGAAGTALITLRVDDAGGRHATTRFPLMVVPSADAFVWETFGYPDGSLVTNSATAWITHGGTTGQLQIANGDVLVSSTRTEDVHLLLPGGALDRGVVFAAFEANFSALPSANEYFAHLNHASAFRARLYAGTNNAARGSFRLGIGNAGATGLSQFPADLNLNSPYTVVVRFNLESAVSSLWINPASESDPAAVASDSTSAVPIHSISLRNNSGIGTMRLGRLRIGRTFADIVDGAHWKLDVAVAADRIEISWPAAAAGFHLQANSLPAPLGWIKETTLPTLMGDRRVVRLPRNGPQRFFRLSQTQP